MNYFTHGIFLFSPLGGSNIIFSNNDVVIYETGLQKQARMRFT